MEGEEVRGGRFSSVWATRSDFFLGIGFRESSFPEAGNPVCVDAVECARCALRVAGSNAGAGASTDADVHVALGIIDIGKAAGAISLGTRVSKGFLAVWGLRPLREPVGREDDDMMLWSSRSRRDMGTVAFLEERSSVLVEEEDNREVIAFLTSDALPSSIINAISDSICSRRGSTAADPDISLEPPDLLDRFGSWRCS